LLATHVEQSQSNKEVTINGAFNIFDKGIAGLLSKSITVADVTLSDDEARNAIISLSGTLTGNRNLIVPARSKIYLVYNGTSGAFDVTVKTAMGTGVVVPQGERRFVYCDGVNVEEATGGGGGGGAPTDAKYVVSQADGSLSDEIVIPSMRYHADIVPGSPNAKDDEFSAGSLDGKWGWLNQGASVIAFNAPNDWATITPDPSSWRGIVQTVPSGAWTVTVRLSAGFGYLADGYAGIWIHGSSDGTGDVWAIGKDGSGTSGNLTRAEQISSYGFAGTRSNHDKPWAVNIAYLRIVWDTTNFQYFISADGIRYMPLAAAFAPGYTPVKFGIATRSGSGFASSWDWFRVT
jgi:hypothetical protein